MEPEIIGNRIKNIMKNKNITIEQLSKNMNIDKKKLKEKLEGKEEFYIEEMHQIKKIFNLNSKECDDLFFNKDIKLIV